MLQEVRYTLNKTPERFQRNPHFQGSKCKTKNGQTQPDFFSISIFASYLQKYAHIYYNSGDKSHICGILIKKNRRQT